MTADVQGGSEISETVHLLGAPPCNPPFLATLTFNHHWGLRAASARGSRGWRGLDLRPLIHPLLDSATLASLLSIHMESIFPKCDISSCRHWSSAREECGVCATQKNTWTEREQHEEIHRRTQETSDHTISTDRSSQKDTSRTVSQTRQRSGLGRAYVYEIITTYRSLETSLQPAIANAFSF